MENYFNYHKILKSGYLYCEEKDSRQTFILTENLGHFSTEGVTAPFGVWLSVNQILPKLYMFVIYLHSLLCKLYYLTVCIKYQ